MSPGLSPRGKSNTLLGSDYWLEFSSYTPNLRHSATYLVSASNPSCRGGIHCLLKMVCRPDLFLEGLVAILGQPLQHPPFTV